MNRFIIIVLLLLPLLPACKSEEGYPVGKDIPNPSELSELPRVYVTTPDNIAVTSKTDWISGSTLSIFDHQGNELLTKLCVFLIEKRWCFLCFKNAF